MFDGQTTPGAPMWLLLRDSGPTIIVGIVPSVWPSPRLRMRRHWMQINISGFFESGWTSFGNICKTWWRWSETIVRWTKRFQGTWKSPLSAVRFIGAQLVMKDIILVCEESVAVVRRLLRKFRSRLSPPNLGTVSRLRLRLTVQPAGAPNWIFWKGIAYYQLRSCLGP